jgi:DNA-binding CsgD family transcriptional regulator/PAS domain-containing protein
MEAPPTAELELIGAIYDSVIDATRWPEAVERIRRHLGFHMAILSVVGLPSGRVVLSVESNVPPRYSELLPRYSAEAVARWGGADRLATLTREEPLVDSEFNARNTVEGNPYYENWARPQGLVNQVIIILEINARLLASAAFGVHESNPDVTAEQLERLRVLAPHLRRAAIISGLLDGRASAEESFASVLQTIGSAVVLVDDQMQVVFANDHAEAMLRAGDPLARYNDRLELRRELAPGSLEAAVRAAANDVSGLELGSGIAARRRDGSGVVVHVLPLQRRRLRRHATTPGGAVAAVFVADPDAELNLPVAAIQQLYGLRPAEARVFELIVEGLSAPGIARKLGIATSTAKTHTRRLFGKLGVHSRGELLRLARRMAPDR